MNITSFRSLKGIFTKVAVAATLAGAVLLATPQKADAQHFSVQFGVGRPYYGPAYGPAYGPVYGPGFYAERRHDDWVRREEFRRHEEWVRAHQFGPSRGFYGR